MNVSLVPETLFTIAGFSVTNSFLVVLGIYALLIAVFLYVRLTWKEVPRGIQFWVETALTGMYDFMNTITMDEERTKKFFPFIMTVFLVFFVANFLPFIPGISLITFDGVPLYRTATTDYSWIFTITVLSVVMMQVVSIATGGVLAYIGKYINFSGPWPMKPLNFFMGIMDIISEIAKIISLSFRLFGNIFAGEVLAVVMTGIFAYLLPVPFALLGILTAVIQAAVFSILVLIFLNLAVITQDIVK